MNMLPEAVRAEERSLRSAWSVIVPVPRPLSLAPGPFSVDSHEHRYNRGVLSLERQNEWRERYRALRPGWRPATEVFAACVRARLPADGRWLDLGCGRGGLVEQLTHPPAQTFGIDPDWASLREHRWPALPRIVAYSDDLPFIESTFDVVTAAWLLEHLASPGRTFAAVGRALRPGGVFIFITPNAGHPLGWANRTAGRLGRLQGRLVDAIYGRAEGDTFPTVYRANSPNMIRQLAAAAGLTLEALEFVADPSYLAINGAAFRLMSFIDDHLPAKRRIHLVGVARKPYPAIEGQNGDNGATVT